MQPLLEPQAQPDDKEPFTTTGQHTFIPNTPNTASQPAPEAAAAAPPAPPAPPTPPNEPPETPMDNAYSAARRKLDTRDGTLPIEQYSEDLRHLIRAAEMIIIGAKHKLDTNQPLSETETTMMKLLGVIPDGPN